MDFAEIQAREARMFLPVVQRMPAALLRGKGARVWDSTGRELLDLTAGWGVTAIGHGHPALVSAIAEQAAQLMQTTNLFYTLPQLELCEQLLTHAKRAHNNCGDAKGAGPLTRAFFVSSGAEAVEGALKLAHRASGRREFVSTHNSFHGRTLGALQVIGQAKHRNAYRELLTEQVCIPFGDVRAAEAAVGAQTAAIIVEPVQGEGGVHPAPPGYLRRLREIAHTAGALLILDEIQTGIGRCGKMFALEHESVAPDIVTLGKGLGGGFPIAAFLCSEAVAQTTSPGDHGGTYAGNPLGCAAANAVLRVVEKEALVQRAAVLGERVLARLQSFAEAHPQLALGARGRGLLTGLVLKDAALAAALPRRALAAGVLVNVTAGNVLRLFPALNIPEQELFRGLETVLELITAAE